MTSACSSQFFRIKLRDDVDTAVEREDSRSRKNAVKRVANVRVSDCAMTVWLRCDQTAKLLQRANAGKAEAFMHILDLAYGRSGKLKWEMREVRTPLTILACQSHRPSALAISL